MSTEVQRRRSKISIEMSPHTKDMLDTLVEQTNADSIHEVVKRALNLYKEVIDRPDAQLVFREGASDMRVLILK